MKLANLVVLAAFAATAAQAQTEQDVQRFERHVNTHDLTSSAGNCVVGLTLNQAGYIAAIDLSKCAGKDQVSALLRLSAALPFPTSTTVRREVALRL